MKKKKKQKNPKTVHQREKYTPEFPLDPGGSYTGNPDSAVSDTPVQDADDL